MTWTYSPSQLATSPLMQVRFIMGDTVQTDQQVQDEEITFALSQRSSIWGAAAMVCRSLASQLSREADTVDKDLRTTLSAKARAYSARANEYEVKASVRGGATPYAGGISISDKVLNEQDPDRVQPQFAISMDDNYLPVAPVGNEGTPQPSDDESGDDV
jgi:hypothetical protein